MEREPIYGLSLLKFEGKDGPVYFVMKEHHFDPNADDAQNHRRFYYEEHSCPTNWIDNCVAVIKDGDADPHGFLEFVRTVAIPRELDINTMDCDIEVGNADDEKRTWEYWFPEAFKTP